MDYLTILLFASLTFIVTYFVAMWYIRWAKVRGIVALDAHKIDKPSIPTRGGVALLALIPFYASVILLSDLPTIHRRIPVINEVFTIIIVILIAAVIGYVDDIKDLGLRKVILSVLIVLPFYLLHTYYPRLLIPFIGRIRITIIYPLLLLIAVPIVVNSINMIDTHNGVMLSGVISVLVPLLLWSMILNDYVASLYLAIALSGVIAMFLWNKYPAKLFLGNVGSYLLGGLLISLIILSGLEYIAFVAMLPIILHGFYLLTSVKGMMTRQVIRRKIGGPVYVENGLIKPVLEENAPFTLTRLLILAYGPMTEEKLVKRYYMVFAFSSLLAFITGYFIYMI